MKTKKFKRIIALVLALTLMLALAAMTASAATARSVTCDACGSSNTTIYVETLSQSNQTVSTCSEIQSYHMHTVYKRIRHVRCNACKVDVTLGNPYTESVCRG